MTQCQRQSFVRRVKYLGCELIFRLFLFHSSDRKAGKLLMKCFLLLFFIAIHPIQGICQLVGLGYFRATPDTPDLTTLGPIPLSSLFNPET